MFTALTALALLLPTATAPEPKASLFASPSLVTKENGVACFGVRFTFKGMAVLEQRYEKK